MKVLIDTHVAMWTMLDDPRLSDKAREIILNTDVEIYYSVASIWELTIKHSNHPNDFLYDGKFLADACDDNGFKPLPVLLKHVYAVNTLKRAEGAPRHKEPFDRILLAQAKSESMMLLTHDSLIPDYNEPFVISV